MNGNRPYVTIGVQEITVVEVLGTQYSHLYVVMGLGLVILLTTVLKNEMYRHHPKHDRSKGNPIPPDDGMVQVVRVVWSSPPHLPSFG